MRHVVMALALALAAAPRAGAQAIQPLSAAPRPPARTFFSATVGLARRQDQPWGAIHTALAPSGWDYFYPAQPCFADCEQRPSQVAEGYPLNLTVAARTRVRRFVHARAFAGTARLGHYPGANGSQAMSVTPASNLAGLQAVLTWRGLWLGAGPTINFDRVTEKAGGERQRVSGTKAGAAISVGATLPARGRIYFELAVERRMSGALLLDSLPVPSAPTVPAMRVSMSHTLLNVGIGLRR